MASAKRYLSMLPEFLQKAYHSYKKKAQKKKWNKQGKPIPVPHTIKQEIVLEYKDKYNIDILIETGTYLGDMVWAQRNNFSRIYSIELSKELVQKVSRRFKKKSHIEIIHGNSGKILEEIIPKITDQAIFWLDAHYSGGITARGEKDCPVYDELKAILSSEIEHIILIDDAQYFIGERDYPTIEGVSTYVLNSFPNSDIKVEKDCIIIELKK